MQNNRRNKTLKDKLLRKEITLDSLKNQDVTVQYYTGLEQYVTLVALFNFVKDYLLSDPCQSLFPFQAVMLTLMHLNTPLQHLAYIFCVSRTTASKVFHRTLNVLYVRLKPFVFWPDRQSIRTSLPEQFPTYPWQRVSSIIDCF